MGQLAEWITKMMLWEETWYSEQIDDGNYIPQVDKDRNPLIFTQVQLDEHLQQLKTYAIHPTHPVTRKCKFGGIDLDNGAEPNKANLSAALDQAIKIYLEAQKAELSPYIEFSGRRGFHFYLFADEPVLSAVMRGACKTLLKRANVHSDEIFPYSDSISKNFLPKAIKLVPAKHLKGGQSGFIDPFNVVWAGDMIIVPDQESFVADIKTSSVDILIELALEQPDKSKQDFVGADWDQLQTPHPECIRLLTQDGVPNSMEYNRANMTLVRYGFSRDMSDEQIKMLAYQMATKSQSHPTSKQALQEKIENFKSVIGSMGKNRKDPKHAWSCSFIWGEKDLRKTCLVCPLQIKGNAKEPTIPINQADVLAEQELIGYILANPDAFDYTLEQVVVADCFLSTRDVGGKQIALSSVVFEAMEGCGTDLRPSTILSSLQDSLVDPCAAYLQEISEMPVCSQETFFKHCIRIRDNGVRLASVKLAHESIEFFLDRKTPIEFALDQMANRAETLHTKQSVGSIRPMANYAVELLEDLLDDQSQCIPTRAAWLNNVLNGGWMVKKLYAIAAGPGAGKTTLLNDSADYAAEQGYPVIEVQFEMDRTTIWFYSLARIAGIDSRIIERRKFLDPKFKDRENIELQIRDAIHFYNDKIAPRFFLKEADEAVTPSVLKGFIKNVRMQLGLPERHPILVIVDYLQLMMSGIESLDQSTNETLRVSRVASALTRVARSTYSSILAISDITKEAYKKALESGKFNMDALRDSFRVVHAAHGVAVLQSGKIAVQKDKKEAPVIKDQIELLADRYADKPRIMQAILQLRDKYPLDKTYKSQYSVLSFVKLRGSVLGTPCFVYEKARHRYVPMELDIVEELSNDD